MNKSSNLQRIIEYLLILIIIGCLSNDLMTHLHDITEIITRRVEGKLANIRHLIFLRSMQFQIIRLPHIAIVRFIASCNINIKVLLLFLLFSHIFTCKYSYFIPTYFASVTFFLYLFCFTNIQFEFYDKNAVKILFKIIFFYYFKFCLKSISK